MTGRFSKERDPVKTHVPPETGERSDAPAPMGAGGVWCSPWQGAAGASEPAAPVSPAPIEVIDGQPGFWLGMCWMPLSEVSA